MTKKKSAKRAFISSFMSFVMCFAMLAGTTFAWYTDSVTSSGNKIIAGTLDIELWMHNGTNYVNISDSSAPIFQSANMANPTNATLWEPGKTQVAYLMIKNAGDLDLKYQVALNVRNVAKNLYEVMKYKIVPDATPESGVTNWTTTSPAAVANSVTIGDQVVSGTNVDSGNAAGVKLEKGAVHYFALLIHMDEEAGNEYMAGEVDFDLKVLATQVASESDSFDNTYDEHIPFPEISTGSATVEVNGAASSITAGGITVALPANTGNTANVYKLDVSDVDMEADDTTGEIEVEFDATLYLNNAKVVSTEEGHIYAMTLSIPAGAELTSVKHNGNALTAENTGADQTYTYNSATGKITIYSKSFSPFSVSYLAPILIATNGTDTVGFATISAFAESVNGGNTYAGYTVTLNRNADLSGVEWTPIGNSSNAFSGIFDGQGYTISNLDLVSASGYAGLFGNVTGTAADAPHTSNGVWDSTSNTVILNSYSEDKYTANVKNLIIDGFEVTNTSGNYVGTAVAYGKDAYFANITVKNSSVNGNGKTGGVIGATGENVVLDYLSTESSVTVSSTGHSVGGIIGGVNRGGSTPHLAVIANCTNRANVSTTDTSNGIAAGILGHGGSTSGLNVTVINCANYGEIKCQTRTAGIVGNAQKVKLILNCINFGKVWNEAADGNNILGGIAGECDTNGLQIVACINNGQVIGFANNGKIAGIIGSIQNANLIEGCVNSGTITNTKANGTYSDITAGAANILVANEATYTVDSSVSGEMTSVTITGGETTCTSIVIDNNVVIEKVFVSIDNFNGTITGLAGKTLYINGSNNTVTIPEDTATGKIVVGGTNCTIINYGTVDTIRFEVAGNHSIENNGTITNSTNNAFTISSTVNGANVAITNNGAIEALGSEGVYALYFSSGATCVVNGQGTITGNYFGVVS